VRRCTPTRCCICGWPVAVSVSPEISLKVRPCWSGASRTASRCKRNSRSWPTLRRTMLRELITVARQWGAAIQKWDELEQATKWSKRMFAYVQGCSFEMQALSAWFYEHSARLSAQTIMWRWQTLGVCLQGPFRGMWSHQSYKRTLPLAQASAAYQRALEHPVLKLGGPRHQCRSVR
jgi:hypothetical protein